MKKTAWSHLPNAAHIDRVLASVKAHPDEWTAAWLVAGKAAHTAAGKAAHTAARNAARNAALDAALDEAWLAAWEAIASLIAWDHAAKYLDMTPDLLRVWHALSGDPACVLLLPYAHARQLIAAKELTVDSNPAMIYT